MEEIWIHNNSGGSVRVYEVSATQSVGISDRHYERDELEALIAWLTQWLSENPVKVKGWVNVYSEEGLCNAGKIWPTRQAADDAQKDDRIACIPVSYHIGEGLEREEE